MQPHTCAMPRARRSRACHQGCARARRERARPRAAIPTPRITPTADASRAVQTLGRTGTFESDLSPDVDTEWGSCCELALDASVAVTLDEAGPPPPPVLGYFAEDELTRLAPSGAIDIAEGERVRVCKDVAVKVRPAPPTSRDATRVAASRDATRPAPTPRRGLTRAGARAWWLRCGRSARPTPRAAAPSSRLTGPSESALNLSRRARSAEISQDLARDARLG